MSNSPSPPRFSTIGLIGNAANAQLTATMAPLVAYLDRRGRRILLDERCEAANPDPKIPLMARSELARQAELIIVIGGDADQADGRKSRRRWRIGHATLFFRGRWAT